MHPEREFRPLRALTHIIQVNMLYYILMHLKSFISNLSVINAVLLVILVLVARYEYPAFFHVQSKFIPPSPAKSAETEGKRAENPPPPPTEYAVIAEQNMFHPERKIPTLIEATPLPKPEFVLYGILIAGDLKLAYMEDMKSPSKGKRQKALKQGETISGFTVKEIDTDKVLMVRGDEKMEVRITDKPRSRSNGTVAQTAPAGSVSQPSSSASQQKTSAEDLIKKRREAIRNARESRGQRQLPRRNVQK